MGMGQREDGLRPQDPLPGSLRQTGRAGPTPVPQQLGANGPAWSSPPPRGGSLSPPLPPSPRPMVAAGAAAVPRSTGPVTQRRLGQVGYVRTAPSGALPAVRGGLRRFRVGESQGWSILEPGIREGPGRSRRVPATPRAPPVPLPPPHHNLKPHPARAL